MESMKKPSFPAVIFFYFEHLNTTMSPFFYQLQELSGLINAAQRCFRVWSADFPQ